MRLMPQLAALLAAFGFSLAHKQQALDVERDSVAPAHRIAIVGGGAAGCSAAYHLSQFSSHPLSITLFERESRVGGRVINVNAFGNASEPVELAGAIFVSANEILVNATRDFGLSTEKRAAGGASESNYDLGVWDGTSFVFATEAKTEYSDDVGSTALASKWTGVSGMVKLFWRYGLSPLRLQWAKKIAMKRYSRLYHELFPFESLTDATKQAGLTETAILTGEELMRSNGVSERFMREVVQASTRVNYGNNLGSIHGLGTMVSMATDGARSVRGGNWQIFDTMVAKSGADLRLDTTVTEIELLETGEKIVWYRDPSSLENPPASAKFDTVIFAIPYHQTEIKLTPTLRNEPENIEYVTQHVTLFASPHRPSAKFFNLSEPADVPDSILTTTPEGHDLSTRGVEALGPENKFWSLSTLRKMSVHNATTGADDQMFLYKTFSPESLTPGFLKKLFDLPIPVANMALEDLFPWTHKQTFLAYPYHTPRSTFGPFELFFDTQGTSVEPEDGAVWYTTPFESFFSTMETSALSGRNVAKLIIQRLEQRKVTKGRSGDFNQAGARQEL